MTGVGAGVGAGVGVEDPLACHESSVVVEAGPGQARGRGLITVVVVRAGAEAEAGAGVGAEIQLACHESV